MSANPLSVAPSRRAPANGAHAWLLMLFACFLAASAARGEAQTGHAGFTDVTEQAGLTHVQRRQVDLVEQPYLSGGAAVGDFFGNGYQDLFFTRHDDTDLFYKNMGDGTFKDVSEEVFGPDRPNLPTNGALMADLDNDGHLDLVVTTSGGQRHLLYMNDGNGRLIEQARQRGTACIFPNQPGTRHTGMSATAGDYTNNGYLDLFISTWQTRDGPDRPINRLFRNRGDEASGYFDDVTVEAGLDHPHNEYGFSGRFADMDKDGLIDLLAVNDYGKSQHLRNNGDGTFEDVTIKMGTGTGHAEMGSTVADFNNDGWLDWFTTSINGGPGNGTGNRLYRNEMSWGIDGIYFSEQTDLGVRNAFWGWGTSFIDFDNDTWRDLVAVNGYHRPAFMDKPILFWRNMGPDRGFMFQETAEEFGLADTGQGRGLIVADFDNDGFQDILVINNAAQPLLFRNNGGTNKWLRIQTIGEISNRMGIGAFITVQPDRDEDFKMVHDVNLGANFLAHNGVIAHFGLGDLEGTIDYIHIRWPSGVEQELFDVEPNQLLTVREADAMDPAVSESGR